MDIGPRGCWSRPWATEVAQMRAKKNPPLMFTAVSEGAPVTFDTMAQAYLEEYVLHGVT